ncbi:MAG: glycosyl transferase family 2 [Verrucomicrobia bacterium]|nr:glycosyl transferase family 2 [Verrucomicrobiota bacterium]
MSSSRLESGSASSEPDSTFPQISIIIVSWNTRALLADCLDSLARGIERSHEIIVVDNASADDSVALVREKYPLVQLIESPTNLGFAKANNLAMKKARGRYFCLVNSDVIVFPGCLDALADYMDRNPKTGIVGPRILNANESLQLSCREFPTLWNKLCAVMGAARVFPRSPRFSSELMKWFAHDRELAVDALVACFVMARRAAVDEFGLLDETFFMYYEDIDWGRRCNEAGWKVMFYPKVSSVHRGGASSGHAPERFAVELQRALLQVFAKYNSPFACRLFWMMQVARCSAFTAEEYARKISGRKSFDPIKHKRLKASLRFLVSAR